MDEDTPEFIQLLCTRAGMIMEDVSAEALLMTPSEAEAVRKKLERLAKAAQAIGALVAAAKAMHEFKTDPASRSNV